MAGSAEGRMNLASLQQRDPFITSIVDTASQVALYLYTRITNEWEKTDIEGTLFVYTRSGSPINGVMILNRLGLLDLIEPLTKDVEFQLQDPFLLYRNAQGSIYGVWFYDNDECARIGQLMNSLVQVAIEKHEQKDNRVRRASESDSSQPSYSELITNTSSSNVDIMQMLSNAQSDYVRRKHSLEPKPIIDIPGQSPTSLDGLLIKPSPLKASYSKDMHEQNTQISLDALFQRASINTSVGLLSHPPIRSQSAQVTSSTVTTNGIYAVAPQETYTSITPSLLQRIMTNPGITVEEIERRQRGETPRDQMPKPAGAEAPSSTYQMSITNSSKATLASEGNTTALTKTLLSSCKKGSPSPTNLFNLKRNSSFQDSSSSGFNLSASAPSLQWNEEFTSHKFKSQTNSPSKIEELNLASSHLPKLDTMLYTHPDHSNSSSRPTFPNFFFNPCELGNDADVLLTPESFKCSSPSNIKDATKSVILFPPTSFETAKYDSSRILLGSSSEYLSESVPQNIHGREQFKATLIHLLQNDGDFLNTIHEAYIKQTNKSKKLLSL